MPQLAPDDVRAFIVDELAKISGLEPDEMVPEASLEELDIDSLDLVELGQIIEERYGVQLQREDFQEVGTLGDALGVVVERCT